MTRPLAALAAAVLLTAAPAAAQSSDPVVNTMLATADLCLRVMQGTASFEQGLDGQGYVRTSSGGRVKPIGASKVVAAMGANTMDGSPVKLCEITAFPTVRDKAGLAAGLATRARPWNLPPMGAGPISGGGTMDGYANMSGKGLIVLAFTERPSNGSAGPSTSVSLIWK